MNEDELLRCVGELVRFTRHGAQYRGRLLGVNWRIQDSGHRDVYVVVELPVTLLKLSIPSRDVAPVESHP
ncbi:hypothetical protein AB0M80_36405 [Amycolatopsis sp. NPDC051045]|uniref:hypothetical protein n=1 Tax=Amycolatopsis sp. NPDC051045 TaxID=3156922 RepID=UPI003417DAE9